jgi:hypothetical protein
MGSAQKIRTAVTAVSLLRHRVEADPSLQAALGRVKRVQSRRFAGTYADLLAAGPFSAATRFFLDELYSDKEYAERDAQFARIAGAIEKLFPAQIADTAVDLAELHALTEELDQAMAEAWLSQGDGLAGDQRYVRAWRKVGRRADREGQLAAVLGIGRKLARLTRKPGLRMMLKMMRGPAVAAGLGSLQQFLENGFDTFAAMARNNGADGFLGTIEERESRLIAMMFDADLVACETELAQLLGQPP